MSGAREPIPGLSAKALAELRAQRGASTRWTKTFGGGGLPKTGVKEKPAITLRRADYDRQKGFK